MPSINKAENEKVKARRKAEAQRQQYENDLSADFLEREPKRGRFDKRYNGQDEEEDDEEVNDFIVDDDEEEEEGSSSEEEKSERIKKAKKNVDFSSDEASEADDVPVANRSKRILDDDDDVQMLGNVFSL